MPEQLGLRLRRQACSLCREPGHNIRRHRRALPGQTWFSFA